MAQATWEKGADARSKLAARPSVGRLKFLIGGVLILGAVAFLVISGTLAGAQYFIPVSEVVNNPEYQGKTVRTSGAVLGDTISYDAETLTIEFTMVNLPTEFDDLATALNQAVNNPTAERVHVRLENLPMPDLLQHEAQAIVTGQLGEDSTFHADELLLKCPSRFTEGGPESGDVQMESFSAHAG